MADGQLEVPNRWIPSPATRSWLYGVLIAVGGLLVALGLLQQEVWLQIVNVLGAIFVIGAGALANANTPKQTDDV